MANFACGMLVVNKPYGMVSKDVSRLLQRRFGKDLKLGHVGTLDPLADGVLPILIGKATRLQDSLLELPKTYRFGVCFGFETSSLDFEGEVVRRSDITSVDEDALRGILGAFTGAIQQIPPVYSAVKFHGAPLYKKARKGIAIDLSAFRRSVRVHELKLLYHSGTHAFLEATCSKGTYVRALARDIAYALGTVATVSGISRVKAAGVVLEDALSVQDIELLENLGNALIPIETLDTGLKPFRAQDEESARRLTQGQKLVVSRDLFAKSLGEFENIDTVFSDRASLFLLDVCGKALGVGVMRPLCSGGVEVHMTRGL